MSLVHFQIKPYNDQYRTQLLILWEKSVLATHDFLTQKDFLEIKEFVEAIDFNDFQVKRIDTVGNYYLKIFFYG